MSDSAQDPAQAPAQAPAMPDPPAVARRRRWLLFVPFVVVVVLAAAWSGGWFYLAGRARIMIDDWRVREAKAGRAFECGSQSIGGFPFRMEVQCANPGAEFAGRISPPVTLKAADALVAWQVYQPALLIGEFTGPLSLGEVGKPPSFRVDWRIAQASARAAPSGVERVSMVFEAPQLARVDVGGNVGVLKADHAELHGRPHTDGPPDRPALEVAVRFAALSAPSLHPLLAEPLDSDATGVLHGLPDLAPKPWSLVLKEWQARGGSLEISKIRVQQGEVIAVGAGTLALTARGGLDGQMQITVVGLEKVLQTLGINRIVSEGDIGSALNALNRFMPGLGDLARQNAGAGIVAGLGVLGQRTTLEGKPAITVPLRFDDGAVLLGPVMIGRTAAMF
jgi:hypothetical protein